jgi:general secretion pathway protein I
MINRNGFTLIETLVAMMLLAISFVIIMQLFSGGLKSSRVTTDYIYGIFHAREKMEEILLSENLIPGTVDGEFDDGYEWRATVFIPLQEEEDNSAARMPVVTADVSVDVWWRAGEQKKHFGINTKTIVLKPKLEGSGE